MSTIQTGSIIKMSGLSVKKENGVFEVGSTWEKDFSCYKLKKDGTRIKHGLDIFSYKKFEQYGKIITLDQVAATITEINKQLKAVKENEIVISFESTNKKEYSNKTYIKVIQPIHTTKSIYAIPRNSIFQLSVNEKWDSVTWQRVGKRGELLSNYDGSNMMNWSNKNMVRLFEESYIEIVERIETVRKDIDQTEEATQPEVEVIETPTNEVVDVQTVVTIEEIPQNDITVESVNVEPITATEEQNEPTGITYKLNNEKNGVEIYFEDKPSEEVRNMLKMNGFRWAKYNKCWYTKQSDNNITLAKQLSGEHEDTSERITEPVTYDHIEIDDCLDEKYNIPQSLQDREHDAYWVMRTSKRDHNKELQNLFIHYTEQVKNVISITDNEYYIYKLKSALQRFKKNYHTAYIKYMTHKANNPSWVTTGRGGMNVSKYNQKMNRQDTLMLELANLPEELKTYISKYRNKIRKDKEAAIKAQIQEELKQPLPELTFTSITKEFDLYSNGSKVKTRFYEAEGYSICKVWGAFRVFETATGKEIYSTKSNGTLKDAKAYVQMLVKRKAA
jgi:hypothetical protein